MRLNFTALPGVIFGPDAEQKAGSYLRSRGVKKVMIHYGTGSVIRSGLLDTVTVSEVDYAIT